MRRSGQPNPGPAAGRRRCGARPLRMGEGGGWDEKIFGAILSLLRFTLPFFTTEPACLSAPNTLSLIRFRSRQFVLEERHAQLFFHTSIVPYFDPLRHPFLCAVLPERKEMSRCLNTKILIIKCYTNQVMIIRFIVVDILVLYIDNMLFLQIIKTIIFVNIIITHKTLAT